MGWCLLYSWVGGHEMYFDRSGFGLWFCSLQFCDFEQLNWMWVLLLTKYLPHKCWWELHDMHIKLLTDSRHNRHVLFSPFFVPLLLCWDCFYCFISSFQQVQDLSSQKPSSRHGWNYQADSRLPYNRWIVYFRVPCEPSRSVLCNFSNLTFKVTCKAYKRGISIPNLQKRIRYWE